MSGTVAEGRSAHGPAPVATTVEAVRVVEPTHGCCDPGAVDGGTAAE